MSLFEYLVGQFNVARNGEGLELREDLQVLAENFDAIGLMERVPQLTESQLMQFVQEPAPSPDEQTLQSAFQLYWFFANAGRYFQILPPKDPMVDEWVSVGDVLFQGLASRDSRPPSLRASHLCGKVSREGHRSCAHCTQDCLPTRSVPRLDSSLHHSRP